MTLEVNPMLPDNRTHEVPLLLLHGMWHGAWCWEDNFMPYFSERGYEVQAMSLRGHGKSSAERSLRLTTIRNYVDDLRSVVESHFETHPVIVGHSMGGFILQRYLKKYDDCPGAILLATNPHVGNLVATLRFARRYPLAFLQANLTWDMYPVVGTPDRVKTTLLTDKASDEAAKALHARVISEAYPAYLETVLLPNMQPDRVSAPVLVLGGDQDFFFPVRQFERTAQAYQAECTIFPGMGHNLMGDTGWENVAERIAGWLSDQGF